MAQPSATWVSFHVYHSESIESFIAEWLPEFTRKCFSTGIIKRFFFIRYSEGGDHLRLRVMPAQGGDGVAALRVLEQCVELYVVQSGSTMHSLRIERHPYSRVDLYFGETLETVYAELLNEATSQIGLRLLIATRVSTRTRRWLLLTATLNFVLRAVSHDLDDFLSLLTASCQFAQRATREMMLPEAADSATINSVTAEVACALPRVARAMRSDPSIQRTLQLLSRARRRASKDMVGTHALHLLCNKCGFSLQEEHYTFSVLRRIAVLGRGDSSGRLLAQLEDCDDAKEREGS